MNLLLSVDRAVPLRSPDDDAIGHWVVSALSRLKTPSSYALELSIRITGREDAARFNQTYRAKPDATNVLSFPADPPAEAESGLLGDPGDLRTAGTRGSDGATEKRGRALGPSNYSWRSAPPRS